MRAALYRYSALFAAIPLVCGPILGWAVVASVGAGPAPFYLAALLAWLYHSFTMPTPSSFRSPAGAAAHGSYAADDSLAGLALTPGSQIAYNGAYWLSSID
jgi:hypothetical protein